MRVYPCRRSRCILRTGVQRKDRIAATNTDVTFIGESVDKTIISFNDYSGRGKLTTFTSFTAKISGNRFRAENISFVNTAGPARPRRLHCTWMPIKPLFKIVSFSATRIPSSPPAKQPSTLHRLLYRRYHRFYFRCGHRRFSALYHPGQSQLVHYRCQYHARQKIRIRVFDCRVIADSSVNKLFLGSPWRAHTKTVFIRCELPKAIAPEGWNNWGNAEKRENNVLCRIQNSGEGIGMSKRPGWAKILSDQEARDYELEEIFSTNNPLCPMKPIGISLRNRNRFNGLRQKR